MNAMTPSLDLWVIMDELPHHFTLEKANFNLSVSNPSKDRLSKRAKIEDPDDKGIQVDCLIPVDRAHETTSPLVSSSSESGPSSFGSSGSDIVMFASSILPSSERSEKSLHLPQIP